MREASTSVVVLGGTATVESARAFLRYIYCGKIDDALHARGAALIRSWEYMRYANRRNAAF